MYRTADTAEDLDMEMELNSFYSVGHAVGRLSFWGIEDKYHDVDFYILMNNNTEEFEIRQLLHSFGMSAWLDYDGDMVKIG